MIELAADSFLRRLCWLTATVGAAGFLAIWPFFGVRTAVAFVLGAAASVGNVFLFGFVSRAISPSPGEAKPWQARAFVTRYILLFAAGYIIVKGLGVNPLAVILGLLSSAVAAILIIVFELIERLFRRRTN